MALGTQEVFKDVSDAGEHPPVRAFHRVWPWGIGEWHITNKRRQLVHAAALLIAEIERIARYRDRQQGGVAFFQGKVPCLNGNRVPAALLILLIMEGVSVRNVTKHFLPALFFWRGTLPHSRVFFNCPTDVPH